MTAQSLLANLRARGLRLQRVGPALHVSPRAALKDADRAALRGHLDELKKLLKAEDELAVRDAAREAAVAWREAAMRAQLRLGEVIPLLKARPDTCYSCGESSRIRGARCDLCFAAAGRVMPLDVLVRTQRRR